MKGAWWRFVTARITSVTYGSVIGVFGFPGGKGNPRIAMGYIPASGEKLSVELFDATGDVSFKLGCRVVLRTPLGVEVAIEKCLEDASQPMPELVH